MRTRRRSPILKPAPVGTWNPERPDISCSAVGLDPEEEEEARARSNGAPSSKEPMLVGEEPAPRNGPRGSASTKEKASGLILALFGDNSGVEPVWDWAGDGSDTAVLERSSGVTGEMCSGCDSADVGDEEWTRTRNFPSLVRLVENEMSSEPSPASPPTSLPSSPSSSLCHSGSSSLLSISMSMLLLLLFPAVAPARVPEKSSSHEGTSSIVADGWKTEDEGFASHWIVSMKECAVGR